MNKTKTLHRILASVLLIGTITACTSVPILRPTPWPTPTMEEVISGFSSLDVDERVHATNWAGFYSDHPDKARLVPYLVEALLDAECGGGGTSVRTYAAQSIRMLDIYDEHAIEILISWLDDKNVRGEELLQGIHTLEVFASYASDATPGLIRVMMNPPPSYRPQVQEAAVRALGAIGDPAAIPYLLSVFLNADEEIWVRKSAAIVLAEYGPAAVCGVPYLMPLLESSEPDIRIGAAIIISQATGNDFPDSERNNWAIEIVEGGGYLVGPWQFERDAGGEYLIVSAAKDWWWAVGRHEQWPQCDIVPDQELLLPTPELVLSLP